MAGFVATGNQVQVTVRGGRQDGRSLWYVRDFAGLTFREAVSKLHSREKGAGLPEGRYITGPYLLNGEEVGSLSQAILKRGDVIVCYALKD
jgi:hypothetical protein